MAAAQGPVQMSEDRQVTAQELQEIRFSYLTKQLRNLEYCVKVMGTDFTPIIGQAATEGHQMVLNAEIETMSHAMNNVHILHNGVQAQAAYDQLDAQDLQPLTPIIARLQQQAQAFEASQHQPLRNVGYSLKIIASNIQHGLHVFRAQAFPAGPFPATRDYPYGPQPAWMRCATELGIDMLELSEALANYQYPLDIENCVNNLNNTSNLMIQMFATNNEQGRTHCYVVFTQQWRILMDFINEDGGVRAQNWTWSMNGCKERIYANLDLLRPRTYHECLTELENLTNSLLPLIQPFDFPRLQNLLLRSLIVDITWLLQPEDQQLDPTALHKHLCEESWRRLHQFLVNNQIQPLHQMEDQIRRLVISINTKMRKLTLYDQI